jgi:hypothetical protein
MRARNAGNGRPSALASGSEQRLEVVKTARGQRPRRRGAADPRFASRARKRAGGEFFEGCETSLRGSPALSTPGISLGNQRGGRRRVREGNQRSPAGTRCNSLGTGARSKPPRWESNHAGGTCGSGGTDRPKGRQLPGSGRAPEMSARHPANEPCASETRRRHDGGGSAAAEWRLARDAMDLRRGSRESTGPTDRWRAAMRAGPSADSPGAAGQPVAAGPADGTASAVRSPACARARVHTGFAARVGRSRRPGGRARARPGVGGVKVSGWSPGTTGV